LDSGVVAAALVGDIARPSIRESSFNAYKIAARKDLVPGVGKHRLERLEPEHLERLYRKMIMDGARPGTAHQVHRTIRTSWVKHIVEGMSRGTWRRWPSRPGCSSILCVRTGPTSTDLERLTPLARRASADSSLSVRSGRMVRGGPLLWRWGFDKARHSVCAGRTLTLRRGRFASVAHTAPPGVRARLRGQMWT
jgi:hypothetical protein